MDLSFEVYVKIKKPVNEVFDAVYRPEHLSRYFTTGGASAPLDEGTEVTWDFHDFPGAFPVQVKQTVRNERIVLEWPSTEKGGVTQVEIEFEALDEDSALVRIKESGWPETPENLKNSYSHCIGWSQMLCCLKVYLEYGKNLREFMF